MVDKNINYNKYFLGLLHDVDESTILNPDLNGKNSPKLNRSGLNMQNDEIKEFCEKNSISENVLFLSSVSLALNKFNFSDENLIFHGNNIIFTTHFENRKTTIKDYLLEIKNKWEENLKYSDFTIEDVIDEYDLKTEFYYSFNEDLDLNSFMRYKYNFYLNIKEIPEGFELTSFYNNQLYSDEYAHTFLKSITVIINQILSTDISKSTISDIFIAENKESVKFKEVEVPFLHKRFEIHAQKSPDSPALVSNGERLTYGELNEKANRIANALIKKGIKPNSNVLVMIHRNSDLIASILGILKAGCAYIPIDLEYPQERIDYIYENSQADYLISDEDKENSLNVKELLKEENIENPDVEISPDSLAYMIYTSGSTGNPKGVMTSHLNITSLFTDVEDNRLSVAYKKLNKTLGLSTVSFDAFLLDFMSLTYGLEFVLANDSETKNITDLTRLIHEEKPDGFTFTTPSRLREYLENEQFNEEFSTFKYIAVGGEMVPEDLLSYILENSDTALYNIYGPTETTVISNSKRITDTSLITVGKALYNYVTEVRDIDGKLLPEGVMGELYIGGFGVAKGYYKLEQKTEEVFLEIDGIPYYRSGDYAIKHHDGEIEIKGRIDNQIKLRGLRIEIGEIESNIAKFPGIKENIVVIKKINNTDHLCAYFTAENEININELKEHLKERLTKYMVPTVFMQMDEMQKTPNGKTDLKALPKPVLSLELVQPETEIEEKLFEIASEISETREFGVTDDLYAIGYTSLTLMKYTSRIYDEMGFNLNIFEVLDEPTIKNIAHLIDNAKDSGDLSKFIEDSKNSMYIPLTENQMGVYYECVQNPDVPQYNIPNLIRFDRSIDAEKLKEAVIETINAYPYLKTRIVMHGDKLMHKRDDSIAIEDIPIVEVPSISDKEIQNLNTKKFDLLGGQLFRAKIYVTDDAVILFIDIHHLITDGESIDKLFRNFANAYEGKEIKEEVIDGYANALIEAEHEGSEEFIASEKYFNDLLTQEVDSTILTPNLNGNPDNGKLMSITKSMNPKLIKEFCANERISPNALFMAGTILNLNKYTFSDETLITTIYNGRPSSDYYNTQGFLVKTLPILSINKDREISVKELLNQTAEIWKETIKHSDYPFTKISEEFQLKPEFMYTYNNLDEEIITIADKDYHYTHLDTIETNYKITMDVNESEDNIELKIIYNDQLYTEKYIKIFLNGILNTINQFITEDIEKLRISEIELNKNYEIPEFTPVETPFIHKRFEKQVEVNPNYIALVAQDATLTSTELNERANRIANALIKKGVEPKSNVLVMLHRNSDLIASILGILKAGCAYIPIDLEYPQERIDYIYENSQADYIISDVDKENSLNIKELLKETNVENPDVEITPDDLAYMIYTSGSTGNPKGVMISHENICNQAENPKSQYESLLCITTVSFDVSVDDILTSISNGVKLILADDNQIKNIPELTRLINEQKPEVADFTPSRLASHLEVKEFCESIKCLKCLFLGGEQFSTKVYENFRKYSDAIVYNSYGPTETTITSNNKEITDVNDITVGYPLHNYVTDVRDIDGKLLPYGVMGELYIGGVSVGKGYYNMSDKTEEVFLTIEGIPYYRSGDYAISRPDGDIEILGRIDNQIKLRGLRIEIGEIESNINRYPSIKQTVVVIKEINNNDHLCAYYTADDDIDAGSLKNFLKDKLTKYMIPTAYMQLDEMPQTPNGKTDLKALPEPKLDLEYVLAENETEQKLFELATELVNTDQFGVTDDLYAIGFTSLILMKLNSLIYAEMGVNLDISVLFSDPTIRKLASKIEGSDDDSDLEEFIELADKLEYFPLTDNQLGVYYECMQNPDEIQYTMPTVIRFGSDVEADKLKDAVIETVEAHPYIKTRIITTDDGSLKQYKNDVDEIDEIEIVKAESISDEDIIKNDVKTFNLGDEQLFRFKIYETDDETVLFSDFHHLITDGVSQLNFFTDITNAYENRELSQEIVDGYVYSLIEEGAKNSEKYIKSKEFFDEKLSQEIESTVLTPNLNGNPDEGEMKSIVQKINPENIKEFCNDYSLSQNALFLSAITLTLNKYTFSDKTLITTIFNGRSNPYYYDTQGFLVKTLPLIFNNENRQETIKEFIEGIDKVWKDTINHSEYPYTNLAENYQLKPEFFFSYQEFFKSEEITINDKVYEDYELSSDDITGTAYKINFDIFVYEDSIELKLDYNDQLYSEEYIQKFLDSINLVLNQFIHSDINRFMINEVELESDYELPTFTPVETPIIHKRFEKQVEANPENIALVAEDATLTAAELNEKANKIANALIKKGVKPKSNVLIMLHRNSDLIASILGILKAGCAYIPIDLEYPQDRIDYIYENSQADYIISDDDNNNSLNVKELLKEANSENPDVEITPDDLAYMIYTSGSTGNPKGVMISHENIANQVQNPKSQYESLLCLATVSFDVSVDDILTSLSNGLKLILASDTQIKNIPELIELIASEKPEVSEITPSRLASYLEVPEFCDSISCLKCVFLGGEQFSTKVYENFKKYSDAIVYNSYGPTETTITSNNKEITDVNDITVGLPLENYVTDVRDIDGKLLPQGVMGELYIGGVSVGKGYYNMPDKTEEVFLRINDIPYYRSGDYAISRPDGEIEILGRIDNQIKLRGLRIEIGEIESSINKYPSVKQAVVVIKEINNNDHLCAYYTSDEKVEPRSIKEFIKDKLTKYMVPTAYMQLDEMPQTPNGKTDLKALPEPKLDLEYVAAESETEQKLFEIASQLINTDQFGVTDDLYAIGFTSLILMKFNSMIYAEMGVNLDISVLFNDPTIRKLASEIEGDNKDSDLEEFIKLADELEYFPLTNNQLGVYYECMQSPGVIKYTMPTVIRFGSDVEAEKLKEAIIKTVEAHPYIKTRIITTDDGSLKQYKNNAAEIDEIEIVKVNSISDDEILKNDVKAFDFEDNQLFRFKIYETDDETVLFLDFHHIITDGVSQNYFFADIANAYENRELSHEVVDGFIYSLIEADALNSEKYTESKEFFDEKLTQEIESTVLTPNLNGNPDEGNIKKVIDVIDSNEIKELCNKYSLSQNALIISALTLTLNKYTFSDNALITTIFNGRSNPAYYETQGFLVKTLPLIFNNKNRQETIKEFINGIDKVWKDTISHSEYPYTHIAEDYQLKPEFFFAYQEFLDSDEIIINGKSYEDYELATEDLVETAYKIDFDLNAFEDTLEFEINYNDELYSEDYIKTFINSIKFVLNQFTSSNIEKQRICDIELESQKELPVFTPVETPIIHKRFEMQVEANPENIVLVAEDATLTADELNKKANRIANALIKKGVKPKNNVLVMLHRNSDLIASILGILKAGCAYIPIDLEYPQDRIDYIYENSQADYIISDDDNNNSLNVKELLKEANSENPDVEITPDDLAYMIYTSGSTGNPKGVMISHENIANQVQNPKSQYESLLCLATISFDVSVDDILTSLTNGLKLILASDTQIKNIPELIELIAREKPEVSEITPSRLASYLEVPEFCNAIGCLKCVFLGGEQFSTKVYENFKKYSDAIVYNSYGPTETTITSNNKEITDSNDITVGLPLENYVTDVRDIDGKLLPQGVMGELYIGGVSVGKGYYNMPDKTEEVFLTINDIPYYRSGDYAIERPNGEIDIQGRIDNQIKLRGLRIEIGEIESSISKYPSVKQAVVVIKEINNNDHLCAYYTADEEVNTGELKEFLKDKLTKYMLPTAYMQLDEMPQTPNGKTDLKALPEPKLDLENIKAENELEEKLFEIAAELINTEEFGVTDDLYAIGFTSLILMKFNSLIYAEMGVNLDISVLFNDPTIRKLAAVIESNSEDDDLSEIIELASSMEYFPLTDNQIGVYYECMQSPGEIKYTMPTTMRLGSDVDAQKLKEAVIKTVEAHPYLKTRIVLDSEGELKQKRCNDAEIDEIKIVEVESISDKEIMENDVKAFSFDGEQLFRVKIYKTPEETVLFTDFHHIITDGVSQINFFDDIANIYEGNEISGEIVDGYVYSLLEDNLKNSDVYEKAKAFFDEKLSHEIESTVLTPNINGNPDVGKLKGVVETVDANEIKEFCNRNSFSQNSMFLSALALTLNKYTFSDKTLITTIFNGRSNPQYYDTQGFLVKTLPLIFTNENRQVTIKEFINSIDEVWKDTMNNSIYPYTNIAEAYQLKPEFFFTYQEFYGSEERVINGSVWEENELESDDLNATEYKINFDIDVSDDEIDFVIQYNDELYTENYIKTFIDSMKLVIKQFMENDINELMICDVELETTKEIPTFSPVETPFIHKRFEKQVEANPDNIALVATDATLTNEELNIKANRIANALIKKGVKARSNVLAMLPRDSNLIATIIGILKAGCTFIPIDLEYPKERIEYIYENSQADYIITADGKADNSLDIYELLEEKDTSNPDVEITPDDLAYMIYTSGSTGNPKGVMIGHKNACNQAESNPKCEYDNLLSIATIAFDTSLEDILTGITNGIKIIFANDSEIKNIVDLIRLIREHRPQVMEFTPSRLISYLEVEEFCEVIDCAKCIVMGGEQFSAKAFNGVKKYCDADVYNSYGPTEATIASNYKKITDPENITIGKALKNYVTEVRDIDGKLLLNGVMGELYIGGVGVGKGYYNMPDKTEEVYLTINNIPYYRSGDYAIELPDGDIDIKGRIDNQIKLRGLRIEIGEIESSINKFKNIKNAVVVIKEINNNDHLCAYFTAEKEIDIDSLKEFLKERLTYYMVPTVFMQLDEIPQLPNGKTDTKKLPEPKLELENVKPENETEQKLFDIISDLIETDEFGTTDDLYAIGYTSLTLMKLNTLIYKEMNVNLDISILFNSPTIKKLADEIAGSDDKASRLKEFIEMANSIEYFPLTENQLGVYYECVQSPGEVKYTMPSVTKFDKEIDAEKLRKAIIDVVEAHPYIKTRIVLSDDGTLKQHRNDDAEIDEIEIVKVDSITDEEIMKNDVKAFSFDGEQLFRFKIYDADDEIVLFSDFHHIITDGESQGSLFEDIGKVYDHEAIEKEIVDGYVFSLIENDLQNSERYESAEKFFDDKLSQEIESTVLTPDINGNPDEGKQKTVTLTIDSKEIDKFCLENSIGHNSLVMSSLILNLNKFTYSDETLITTIFNGRTDPNYFNTQGFLVKTLPLIIRHENREQTIEKFIKSVDKTWIDSINNCIYPYTKIADKYQLKPEFFYSFDEGSDSESLSMNGRDYESYELSDSNVEMLEYKIDINVFKKDCEIEIALTYNDQLYSEKYIKTFLDSTKTILDQFVGNDIRTFRICDVELESINELPTFTPVENPIIHKRFEKQVEANPDYIALVADDAALTAGELNERANKIANALIKKGVEPKSNVLIMLHRNSDLIASILGILKAGCAYIPIDLEYPQERINYIYENSQADYIISNMDNDTSLNVKELLKEEDSSNPDVEITPDDLAYMIYTSGSTGNPKGVMISHENICNQVQNPKSQYESLLCLATVSFDVSVDDILTSLSNGVKLILASDTQIKNIPELIKLIDNEKPEVSEITPSRLASYLEVPEFCEVIGCLKCVFLGGEQFSTKVYENFKKYSDAIVYNSYGPTETTITSNNKEVTDVNDITVGLPLENYMTDVRDIDGKLLPQGVMGELYIGGIGVGKGYYNMPEKTEEVFLTINDIPYYRSGDYAIERPNGEIDIQGRIDNQIKLRGLRIEIGEIEANITRFPSIKHAVVVIKKINNSEHLCAYFTGEEDVDVKLLKRYLQNKLTKYMVPTVFMQIDEMPQTPNGKTDIKALPEPSLALEIVEPETETEKKIFELVSTLTSAEEFGITDDLYSLGFTSLTLMKLNSMIYNETDVNIEITDLFNTPTIQSLSDKIDNNIDTQIDIPEILKTAETMELFPLTSNQLGIYYECMQTEEIKYTMPSTIRFGSDVDPYRLRQAIIDTIEAHPYLKTRIITTPEGELRQKRCDDIEIDEIEIVEVDSITNKEMMDNDIQYIPIEDNQLFRFKIYKTPDETVLFIDIHHIITDGVSQDLLFEDMMTAYSGEGEFNEEIVDGFTYSLIEAELSENEVSKEYYKNKFAQGFESTVLTPNLNGNPDDGKIKLIEDRINSNFVRLFCQDHSISPNVLFMSATILALNKFTFSDKALITTIFNGRSNSNYFNTQGMLVKTLPIMVGSENRSMMVEDFIKVVDKSWKDALVHSNYPFTKLSEEYQLKPEFFYAYHGAFETDNLEMDGNTYAMEELDGTVATDYKINLDVYDDGEEIGIFIEYNDQIYTEDYAKEFLTAIKYILVQFFVNDMDKLRIEDIELATNFLLPEFEELDNPFLHKRFEFQVAEKPNEIALVASDASLTYEELDKKANRIANSLIRKGVKPGSNILIMLPRDSDLIASIIGVLKAGCAFIPLDLKFPKERIEYIYENSQADYIINIDGLELNSLSIKELLKEDNEDTPDISITKDDTAYMIYTSGSTGNPKGVMISHENVCNQVEGNPKCEYNNLLSIATIAFDTALEDILTGITNGIKIIFANDDEIKSIAELIRLIKREKPEVMEFTPSRLLSYLEFEDFCDAIGCAKCIVMGGEQFSAQAFNSVKKYSDAAVYNSYGPTEATIASNYKEITDPNNITIGKALRNYVTEVRDIDGKLLPKGVMGELYIGGVGVGKGYYNMPDKTGEVYLTIDNIPYYKSGDYAIELPDGEIDIKGRIDNQIKLRGLRIEIGEIESNISNFPNIRQNIVVIKKIRNNEHLCAYFTADSEINKDELKAYLGERLTQYMVPTVFMQIDEMPQTPNGKTDIKALPEPKLELTYVAPKNKLEQSICAIYSSILDIEIVGAEDNFFEIGGTSLIASKLIIELLKQDYEVKYDDIFRNQTPRKLASFLSGDKISDDLDVDIIENYDYTKINELLEQNTFENFAKGKNLELGNVLLTGVTGFMGVHILYEYLKNEEGTIYCMLRKGGFDTCEERFIDLMDYYYDEDFSDLIGSRIILSEGDITNLDDFKKLENYPIDTIINCAAIVKHYTHDDYIFRVNVDGVINGLEFADAHNMTYVQISTTSVLDEYAEDTDITGIHCDERTLYWGQDLSNKYLNSKFLAERMVLEKALTGLNVKIIRVGNLMARQSDGVFQKNFDTNAFLNNIKAIKNLKATIPAISEDIVELSPIDYVAKATLELAKTPKEITIFHAESDKLIPTSDIIDVLNEFGFGIEEVTPEEFRKIYEQNMDENIQGIITADLTIDDFTEDDEEIGLVESDDGQLVKMDQTLEILKTLGFEWPECDKDYLTRFIKHLIDVKYFD